LNESGKRFKEILEFAEQKDENKNAYFIAEFAIGTNPKAKVIGNVLEDEKVLGTAHIAVGDNTSYPGGKNYSILHQDGIMFSPTIELDGMVIMRDGKMSALSALKCP
jgi:leucyl aminopeptidase (aminopeptidase T)